MQVSRTRLEVWGDPIAHSHSPALHTAAYARLGLAWTYGRRQVGAEQFASELAGLGDGFRGLSLTMPLKEAAFAAAEVRDDAATLTGAVNTLLLGDRVQGFNTDVPGIVDALAEHDISAIGHGRILGAGATAASALVALARLGAERIDVRARRPERAAALVALGERIGTAVTLGVLDERMPASEVTIATLPSGTVLAERAAEAVCAGGGALLDAAYAPWPSALASRWHGMPVISGVLMLLHQAVRQVRIFTTGDADQPLPDEERVVSDMRAALMGD